MVRISRKEMKMLNTIGVNFGENGISHTTSTHHRAYYLCESRDNMALLNKIRNAKVIESHRPDKKSR